MIVYSWFVADSSISSCVIYGIVSSRDGYPCSHCWFGLLLNKLFKTNQTSNFNDMVNTRKSQPRIWRERKREREEDEVTMFHESTIQIILKLIANQIKQN